ncbi:hypothetical protein EV175_006361 [Coemansia sp. RSA 1933]|nr:hypothetical protein EV175_006361 [Coemansia sp. RSA 1933]
MTYGSVAGSDAGRRTRLEESRAEHEERKADIRAFTVLIEIRCERAKGLRLRSKAIDNVIARRIKRQHARAEEPRAKREAKGNFIDGCIERRHVRAEELCVELKACMAGLRSLACCMERRRARMDEILVKHKAPKETMNLLAGGAVKVF